MNTIEIIYQILEVKHGISKKEMRPNACIREDIGLDGDDSFEFFENLLHEFDIDWSWLDYNKYFHAEGLNPFNIIKSLYMRVFMGVKMLPITIGFVAGGIDQELQNKEEI